MINNLSKKGIITSSTVFMLNLPNSDLESTIKRFSIFFEELYFFDNDPPNTFKGGIGNPVANTLQNILIKKGGNEDFILSQDFTEIVQNDRDFNHHLMELREKNADDFLLMNQKSQKIFNQIVFEKVKEYENPNSLDGPIINDFYQKRLLTDYKLFHSLSVNQPDYSGVLSPIMKNIIFGVHKKNVTSGEELIKEIAKIEYIDFGKLTWREIYELRQSGFAKDFRSKMRKWLVDFENDNDLDSLNEKIAKLLKESSAEFRRRNRKSVPVAILTVILGKTPIKYILNSVSIGKSIKMNNDFRWMHFIDEMESKSK